MSPEPESVAQLMQRRGLQHRRPKLWGDKHRHLGLKPPHPLPTDLDQLQSTAAIAGAPTAFCPPPGRPLAQHLHLGLIRILDTHKGKVA